MAFACLGEARLGLKDAHLRRIFQRCLVAIGGTSNPDVRWYLKRRPKRISRQTFFEEAVWAIWVAGMSRVTGRKFLDHAEANGFEYDFARIAKWDARRLREFMESLHGRPVPARAVRKWKAVHLVAREVWGCGTDKEFRRSFFDGKVATAKLDETDVDGLVARRLPFIRSANAHFIVRNMGGEAIKCDRWIQAFLRHYRMSLKQLAGRLRTLSIRPGLFDVVIWAYCERFVRRVSRFGDHLGRLSRRAGVLAKR